MAYGVSNGHVTTWRDPKSAARKYGRLPSDSLASCYVYWRMQQSQKPSHSRDRRAYAHFSDYQSMTLAISEKHCVFPVSR